MSMFIVHVDLKSEKFDQENIQSYLKADIEKNKNIKDTSAL